MLLDTED
jgi:hypothetical protein